jgi:hypothetical protein
MRMTPASFQRLLVIIALTTNMLLISPGLLAVAQTQENSPIVSATIESVLFEGEAQTYRLSVSISNPSAIQILRVVLWNEKDGVQITEQEHDSPAQRSQFSFETKNLIPGQDYSFRIFAYSSSSEPLFNAHGQSMLAAHKVRYNPEIQRVTLNISSVAIDGKDLLLHLEVISGQLVNSYSGWMVDESTNTLAQESGFHLSSPADSILRIPLGSLPSGKYSVYIKALDENGYTLAESRYGTLSYQPPRKPSIFVQLTAGINRNPIILFGIIAIMILLISYLMVRSHLENRRTGTPFLQASFRAKAPGIAPIHRTEVNLDGPQPVNISPKTQPYNAGRPNAYLLITMSGGKSIEKGRKVVLDRIPFTIGREHCDLSIEDARVSRRHARINWIPAAKSFYITDLKSSNGVTLNGSLIPRERQTVLDPDTVIRLSRTTEFIFKVDDR